MRPHPVLTNVHLDFTRETPDHWQLRGACASADPEAFFSGYGEPTSQAAKNVCANCPVVQACAEYAIADPSLSGYWGNLSELQRKKIRKERREAAA